MSSDDSDFSDSTQHASEGNLSDDDNPRPMTPPQPRPPPQSQSYTTAAVQQPRRNQPGNILADALDYLTFSYLDPNHEATPPAHNATNLPRPPLATATSTHSPPHYYRIPPQHEPNVENGPPPSYGTINKSTFRDEESCSEDFHSSLVVFWKVLVSIAVAILMIGIFFVLCRVFSPGWG